MKKEKLKAIVKKGEFQGQAAIIIEINECYNSAFILTNASYKTLEAFHNKLKEIQLFGYEIIFQ